jgi:hypothetical protein
MRRSRKRPWRLVEDATGQVHGTFSTFDRAQEALDEWMGRDCAVTLFDFTIKRRRGRR